MDEDIKKMYQDEFKRVEEELIDLRIAESYFDFYDKTNAKNKKAIVVNTVTASTIYSILIAIFDKVQMLKVPKAAAIYIVFYALMYSIKNHLELKKLKKINVLELEMGLYNCYEKYKGLANADFSLIEEAESQDDKDNFVKMKK